MEILDEIEQLIISEMNVAHSFYATHVAGPRLSFRILGTSTLFLSVAIPFISQSELPLEHKSLWITGLSLGITVVTGISTFFKPDETWKLNMGAKLNLESLFAIWKLECLETRSLPDTSESLKKHFEASRRFLRSAQAITAANTEGFFTNVSFPDAK
ncbi:DUF4231 domain-containing protein [Oceanobacter mangrovi]|uniref:DUF4231 domain-containing protein n=1 Tax=Oceanobacter mangrovi TaxID=2862510 RepID=UPI001C8D41D3|nr:DUF4231 domain-containing protein [Oceanobacter mangrovi]